MLGIIMFLVAVFLAFLVACVISFRIAMNDRYGLYRKYMTEKNAQPSWVGFFFSYQLKPSKSRNMFGPITFPRYLLLTFIALTPLSLIAHFYL